jgi:hypothetical protein
MQVWYLSPFLLALLVWGVATRRHPDDKEKWAWLALGVCAGAVLMFVLVFFSERDITRPKDVVDGKATPAAVPPTVMLEHDQAKEVLSPTKVRRNRTVAVGSLQITVVNVTRWKAQFQLDPPEDLHFFSVLPELPKGTDVDSHRDKEWVKKWFPVDVLLGRHLDFGYRGRLYRLGLLETQLPLWGVGSEEIQDVVPSYAVIRLLDEGPYYITDTKDDTSDDRNKGRPTGGAPATGSQ